MATVSELPPLTSKCWTYEDYCRLGDEQRYEILDGELLPMQPPGASYSHSRRAFKLGMIMEAFAAERHLGEVTMPPLDVRLDERNVVQPDVIFIATKRLSIATDDGIRGAPDIVVEVISPSSKKRDREQKKEIYRRFGVKEFWLVDPTNRSLLVLALEGDAYVEHALATGKGHVTSRILVGLTVKVDDVF